MKNVMEVGTDKNPIAENKLPIKRASLMVRAVNSSVRQQILQFIYEHGKATVTEIHKELRLDQPAASRHLAILRAARVVNADRDGRFVYYSANNKGVDRIIACVKQLYTEI